MKNMDDDKHKIKNPYNKKNNPINYISIKNIINFSIKYIISIVIFLLLVLNFSLSSKRNKDLISKFLFLIYYQENQQKT